ncbi:MAG TPA: glucoamylase family protein [Micropepsaceae bacterium]
MAAFPKTPQEPIRSELFSVERLESHAESLAEAQIVVGRYSAGRPISSRLSDNAKILTLAYRIIAEATQDGRPTTPAAEWMLDNFHVVEEQIREVKNDLPPRFYHELPKLAGGHLEGYPRVFGLAWNFIAHTDSRFDLQTLVRFVAAYQRVQPLTIGELWAITITLRIILVENLRRLAEAIVRNLEERKQADALADRLLGEGGQVSEAPAELLHKYRQSVLPLAFAAQLDHRLRDQDPAVAPAHQWLVERLAAQGTTPDRAIQDELRLHGALNVTVRNVITSMRMISETDWAVFFESVSLVDAELRADSEFEAMDFATRNLYRLAIERLARGSGKTELEVARRAIARAKKEALAAPEGKLSDRERDPGYYLIARGVRRLERDIGFHPPPSEWLTRLNRATGCGGYMGLIVLLTVLVAAIPVIVLMGLGLSGANLLWLGLLGLVPGSEIAIAAVNRMVTRRIGPAILPGMELADGVPAHLRTMIVMPVLLTKPAQVRELIEQLEVHHLASSDGDLYFALLSDWADCENETAPSDGAILDEAIQGIAQLNARYGPAASGARFRLLHRHRVWNESENRWIGWERKRGKLHELNRLLRGATDTGFLHLDGKPPEVPPDVRYVITLDADTRLPREAAKRLIGKMDHPLNRPRLDPKSNRVVEGHAVLQPRVTPSLPVGFEGSLFQRVFSSPRGLDPYAFAVSDVYQDLFEEGSYTGKGIYEVDTFEAALDGRIPENSVLSHDLLEGIFARAGLVSDIEVVEEFPSRYDVAAARQHRWVRGDWQLLPWILGFGRDSHGHRRNVIPLIGRWKMLDNLRRSLLAPATLLAFLYGWMLPYGASELWMVFILATIMVPSLLPWFAGLVPHRRGGAKRNHLRGVAADFAVSAIQIAFMIIFLAHQAWVMLDAVTRTLFRLLRRRHLLEWVTAAQISRSMHDHWPGVLFQLAVSFAFAVAALVLFHVRGHGTEVLAAPFVTLWAFSPVIAWWSSRSPPSVGRLPVTLADAKTLRKAARRTWRFFESFVTREDHHLPPDNFQQDPKPVVARRTSPTNIGLYLVAIFSARDFGWLGTLDAVERLEATLESMKALEQFNGHFYNWYATDNSAPLHPKYVSTVDSGNLAGHLVVVAQGCREMARFPLKPALRLAGVRDCFDLACEALDALTRRLRAPAANMKRLGAALDSISALLEAASRKGLDPLLAELVELSDAAAAVAQSLADEARAAEADETLVWVEAMSATLRSHARDLEAFQAEASHPANHDLAEVLGLRTLSPVPVTAATGNGDTQTLVRASQTETASPTDSPSSDSDPLSPALANPALANPALANPAKLGLAARLNVLADTASGMYTAMRFDFLYDSTRQLFSIGYRVDEAALDPSCYDLLASEARLASFIAIAREDAPPKHWFRLGRTLTPVGHGAALISWSGSMFEYLMPSLVMRAPAGSILDQTNRIVVRRQIEYGRQLGVPWGVSESLFNARDIEGTYQYAGFGVPDLGYKRGLSENVVIAPYATALAAMIDPAAAAENFRRLTDEGGLGDYGWYDALDYTATRLPKGAKVGIVRAYMAHHQAMSIVAIADALLGAEMRDRFHADPSIQATELLLQERMPRDVAVARPPAQKIRSSAMVQQIAPEMKRQFNSPHSHIPRTHLLSNGTYAVMVTGAGSGYSRWRNIDVTRWREDVTCDDWGSYIFLRDTRSGETWSAGYQPTGMEPDFYEVSFFEDRAEFVRQDGTVKTMLEVAVSPENDGEVRRVSITNLGTRTREIELTSYAELVLAPYGDDATHPAFSKLFVETEYVAGAGTLLATRRRRSPDQAEVWAAHLVVIEGDADSGLQFETDRARFLGRGQRIRNPQCVMEGWPLSNTVGCVLDPIFSLRCRVRVPRGETVRLSFWTVVAPSRQEALDLADKHRDPTAFDRVGTMSWTQVQGQFHYLGIDPAEAHLFQRLANRVIYSDPALRPASEALKRGGRNISALWAYGISGDLPIVLVRIDRDDDIDLVKQLIRAFEYWRIKRLSVDIVILNERATSYLQTLQETIEHLVRPMQSRPKGPDDVRGDVFVLRSDLVPQDIAALLHTVARMMVLSRRGTLAEQLSRIEEPRPPVIALPRRPSASLPAPDSTRRRPAMEFFNGMGGFAAEGREYVTVLERGQSTPAPWINVISNENFGFQVSTDGSGFTWSVNSQQNRLTPWSNDPVGDPPGETIFLRDEDSGELWTPTALPIREEGASYLVRHGQGYSRFEVDLHGLALDLVQYVPLNDPVKISRLKITNNSRQVRNISVTSYVEWVLGPTRAATAPYIVTEIDPETGAMFARNPLSNDYGTRVAFTDLDGRQSSWTGDRTEFLGRNRTLRRPIALLRGTALSSRTGAGFDPCGALQTSLRLKAGSSIEVVFLLGEAASTAEAQRLITKYRTADLNAVLAEATEFWDEALSSVQVKTPDRALDIIINRWALYQALACRVWSRSGFYQSSGAYGFRDQLQDSMALAIAKPGIARAHLLRAAGRQFPQGDVQHWWLAETGRGVRTRVSDDRVWLAYVTAHYVRVTGDLGVLDEQVPFLDGPPLQDGQHDAFFQPSVAKDRGRLFAHCAVALDSALSVGGHGLPLMGTGDWNDGMNRVGEDGKGESVWLGWFLYATLTEFSRLADIRDPSRAARWRGHAEKLKTALEKAWDGDWYRRAYFDDGTPLGSVANTECRIDSIAQSWSVLSGAAEPARAARAMAAVEKYLVRRDEGLVLLFTPPFEHAVPDPGYIKGYPAGIRENGGQYTHAALWSALAYATLGDGDRTHELLTLLNPIQHAGNSAAIHRYKVEPYVICADVYGAAPHTGRGGWTWYTGSAAWMYRVALESLLGFQKDGETLILNPCIPRAWPGFEIRYRHGRTMYEITVQNRYSAGRGVTHVVLDGVDLGGPDARIPLKDDGATHKVSVTLG